MKQSTDTQDSGVVIIYIYILYVLFIPLFDKSVTQEAAIKILLKFVCKPCYVFFSTLTRNIRHRRGEKVVINVPSEFHLNPLKNMNS